MFGLLNGANSSEQQDMAIHTQVVQQREKNHSLRRRMLRLYLRGKRAHGQVQIQLVSEVVRVKGGEMKQV